MVMQVTAHWEKSLKTVPTMEDLGGRMHLAILSNGERLRHTYFKKAVGSTQVVTPNDISGAPELTTHLCRAAELLEAQAAVQVFVDVSCLDRPFIALVFACIAAFAMQRSVNLTIGYSLARYAPSPATWAKPVRTICPVHPMFSGWTAAGASAPVDVVVGLGYERGKAVGAVEYLEPRRRWVCVPHSPFDEYLQEVKQHNRPLLERGEARVLDYNVLAPVDAYFSLRSLLQGIACDARPVLFPFGPKIFFAVSLLAALSVEEAAVWQVSGESDDYGDRSPSQFSVLCSFLLSQRMATEPDEPMQEHLSSSDL